MPENHHFQLVISYYLLLGILKYFAKVRRNVSSIHVFLGGLSLHLNHLIP